jgi:hypothetical protein
MFVIYHVSQDHVKHETQLRKHEKGLWAIPSKSGHVGMRLWAKASFVYGFTYRQLPRAYSLYL